MGSYLPFILHGPQVGKGIRVLDEADLISLVRELNRLGVASVVAGGFAINRLGFVRATEDIDLGGRARKSTSQPLRTCTRPVQVEGWSRTCWRFSPVMNLHRPMPTLDKTAFFKD